ncbi:zinc finger protein 281-like isoform X1 [Xyrauchen texanus]|uniref:zinc finger protein 281-like isoform X1 n=2 Tax=Xyrauchen texanus TaxID=154827 RepID=UPI00224266E9|nr:zinc finger protein 281-like isoform X1 [Xyrauchen texanus]
MKDPNKITAAKAKDSAASIIVSAHISSSELNELWPVEDPNMSIIQDKLGNEFLRNGGTDPNFSPSMIMFSHLPPVTSFTRLTSQTSMVDMPQEMILKKERDSPDHGGCFLHSMGIKQEKLNELDYRLPMYETGSIGGKSTDMLDMSLNNHQNMLLHDLSHSNQFSDRLGKDPKESGPRRGRRANGEGPEGKARRKQGDSAKSLMLDGDAGPLSPNSKPHICEHCNAAFRSSYHLRRHVLIHTGERPFRCSQCNMSFIQKYLLQRHEKIHSGEKPFSCDQCNMRFIQKYHMERHKRTHSGEKPYKCDTCLQYFSRTDRLLKHKRTCGEAMKKGLDPEMLDLGDKDMGQGSYQLTQGNTSAPPRKKGKSKSGNEGGERRRKKGAAVGRGLRPQDYTMNIPSGSGTSSSGGLAETSMDNQHGHTPKLVFKKGGRKGMDKGPVSMEGANEGLHEQKLLTQKQGTLDMSGASSMDSLGLLQTSSGPKQGGTSSNYDDAMQFLKKRRYLHAANSNDFSSVHLPQPTVIQGGIGEPTLALLDTSPLVSVDKHDKSGIPDEVLQSLLDHYSHKSDGSHHDVTFDLYHVELQQASATSDLGHDEGSPSGSGDKSGVMNEYSKFLLQTLERTSHSSSFALGPCGPFAGLLSSSSSPASTLFSDKNIYATSPMECGFGQSVSSPLAPSSSSLTKSHFGMLVGSPSPSNASPSSQLGFHLGGLEPATHQQLTPSQELTDQLDKQHSPSYRLTNRELTNSSSQKDQQTKNGSSSANGNNRGTNGSSSNGSVYPLAPPPDLATLESSKEGVDMRSTYQIENFAQAFGSQFKSGCRTPLGYGSDPRVGEVDHRIQRTPVSEFSGFTSLLADVNEPASSGSKTSTSQSYR